jgi:MFS family permease
VDLITGVLVAGSAIMLACALAAGQTYWWNDAPFLGELIIGAVLAGALALMIEARRKRPEINLQWLSRRHIVAIMAVALVERVSLSAQTSSAPGLLALRSLNNDQYHHLFAMITLAMFVGILVMLKTLGPKTLLFQMVVALGCIAMGALLACANNSLVRPDDLILSQCLIGFGATLFAGPALVACISQVLQRGAEVLVPTVLVFAVVQNFGTLAGTALLSSVQYISQQTAIAGYANRFRVGSPLITQWSASLSDLSSSAQQQAAVIGYLNSFRLVVVIALIAMLVVLATALYSVYTTRAAAEGAQN